MPKLTQAERCFIVRAALGYGGKGRAAAFAKWIGIKPSSLHNLAQQNDPASSGFFYDHRKYIRRAY